ncbi:hypothetical protein T265_09451 [Opisthorchis viverrini]|uniref:Peptidase A1 domain-containing protein n=1 Tax=Opisthorchis viverrini TaxID=6198 RepID=A0A074Z5X6_OPIVI|nr:hypothetical protein T265_09451 [Opisthorchis viverrini]KER22478.1 hypothetical protein T265_09451 [Opisthorchis viverrini]
MDVQWCHQLLRSFNWRMLARASGNIYWRIFVGFLFGDTLIKNTPFGLVMDATEKVSVNPYDGIIGLGRRSMSPEQTQPLLYAVHQQMQMRRKFGFQFQDRGGSFWMGENAKQIFSNDVTYVNVIDGPYWETRVSWIYIFKTGIYVENHRMIFDTGTHEIHLPASIHMAINEALQIRRRVDRVYLFDCARLPLLPPVTFQIEGKMFQIMPKQYTSLTTTNGETTCRTLFYNTSDDCPVGLIMGMSFLHSFQLIFDDNAGKFGGMLIGNVPFGLVMAGDENVYDNPFDGIIGLGRRSVIPENTHPLFHSLHQQGLMSRKFGFYFQHGGATFVMGDNLEQLITDPVTYINVAEGPYWETRVNWIFIDDSGFCTEDHRMLLDTGTNTIDLPGDIHMAINNVLGIWRTMHHVYVFDCERLPDLPPITFQIQGKMLQIMPKQYTKQVDNLFYTCDQLIVH